MRPEIGPSAPRSADSDRAKGGSVGGGGGVGGCARGAQDRWATFTPPKGIDHGHSTRGNRTARSSRPRRTGQRQRGAELRGGRLLPHHPAHGNEKSRRRNAQTRRSAENRNENRRRGWPLRRQGRAPQPADRRPD